MFIENASDIFLSALVVLFILSIIVISWMSTYVREQAIISTTLVVLQGAPNTSTSSASLPVAGTSQALQNLEHSDRERMDSSQVPETKNEAKVSVDSLSSTSKESDSTYIPKTDKDSESSCSNPDSVTKDTVPEESKESKATENSPVGSGSTETSQLSEEKQEENTSSGASEEIPPGSFKIRLVFLDETQKIVYGQPSEEVGSFKREHFEAELSTNCTIRLIFNGQLLSQDSTTLGQYGLFDNCALHCIISQPQIRPVRQEDASDSQSSDIDLSELMNPIFLGVIAVLWYMRFEYSFLFNASATFILIVLTILLLIVQYNTIGAYISNAFNHIHSLVMPRAETRDDASADASATIELIADDILTDLSSNSSPTVRIEGTSEGNLLTSDISSDTQELLLRRRTTSSQVETPSVAGVGS